MQLKKELNFLCKILEYKSNLIQKYIFVIIFLLSFSVIHSANVVRETRAVWIATNFRLDWPPKTYDQEKQKKELVKIFDDIKSKKLNTVYFQVRSNGTVMFQSSYEPLSPYITGEVDGEASYDPLKYAIQLAHERGLEIHAWVNVVRCFSGSDENILKHPYHIYNRRPDWVIEYNDNGAKSYWMDMGLPEVRHYLTAIFTELVQNYDIDGLQMDFIRYPGKDFNDSFSYNLYGGDLSLDDWRRANINNFVKELSKNIKIVKSYIKLGAAPLGIYKNSNYANGFEGYSDVYQDSRDWLQNKYIDYVVPQIYWPIEGPPPFKALAIEWKKNDFGRSVVLGLAAYKSQVKQELNELINFSRKINSSGYSFFRYSNIKDYNFTAITNLALPAEMKWLEKSEPEAPKSLTFNYDSYDPSIITLNWANPSFNSFYDSASYYALYSLPKRDSNPEESNLFEIVSSNRNSIKLAIDRPKKINYYFTLKSLNKLWNESINPSNVVSVTFRELSVLSEITDVFNNPVLIKSNSGLTKILLYIEKEDTIAVSNSDGTYIKEYVIKPGKNILSLDPKFLSFSSVQIKYENSGRKVQLNLTKHL